MNPVKLKKKGRAWITCLFILILSFIFAIILAVATPKIHSSCSNYKIYIIIEPIWLFIYYRIYSRLLIKAMDALTCTCAEHGIGYAIFHYAIWSTIGHPYICFLPFIFFNISQSVNILTDGSCTANPSMSDSSATIWNVCFIIFSFLCLLLIIPAGVIISYKNHKDVKFQLHWKERNEKERVSAIAMAIEEEITFNPDSQQQQQNNNNMQTSDNQTSKPTAMYNVSSTTDEQQEQQQQQQESNPGTPVLVSAESEEQIRAAIAASMLTAQKEEENRNNENNEDNEEDIPKDLHRQRSESLSGFWAKGQAISTAYLTSLFSEKQYECVVCYEDYEVGQTLAKLKCGHQMHKKCAMDWLKVNPTCPFCRVNIMRQ